MRLNYSFLPNTKLNTLLKGSVEKRFERITLYHLNNNWVLIVFANETLEQKEAVQIYETMKEFGGGKRMKAIVETNNEGTVDKEFRNFVASFNFMSQLDKGAVVIHSTAQKLVGNFFINFNKPSRPVKLFSNMKDAIKWLEE